MFRCFRKNCNPNRSPSRSPARPKNLSRNELGEIARFLSPRNRRALSMATNRYTRKTLPIGLAVTKVGAPPIQVVRPPAIVRSRSTAKPLKLPNIHQNVPKKQNLLNTINPVAYKNTQWRHYKLYTYMHNGQYPHRRVFFYNTANGEPFLINNKTGQRKPVPARVVVQGNLPMNQIARIRLNIRPRKTIHTWNAYINRAGAAQRYAAGESKRNQKFNTIHNNVVRYIQGNQSSINKYPLSDLMYWAKEINWSTPNSSIQFPYFRKRGMWFRRGRRVTKENMMNHIIRRFRASS